VVLLALGSLGSECSGVALGSLGSECALWSGVALWALWSRFALWALWSGVALRALWPCLALSALWALRTLWAVRIVTLRILVRRPLPALWADIYAAISTEIQLPNQSPRLSLFAGPRRVSLRLTGPRMTPRPG